MSDPRTPGRVAEPAVAYAIDTTPSIDWIVARIVEAVAPTRIWLFGSRARGSYAPDSDVDLVVETERAQGLGVVARGRLVHELFAPRSWSLDAVVCTPEEAMDARERVGTLMYEVAREGRVVHERS